MTITHRPRTPDAPPSGIDRGDPLPEPLSSRRRVLRGGCGILAAGAWASLGLAEGPAVVGRRARRFLVSLFDPALALLPEFSGSNLYWLYHDNYLAAKVLGAAEPAMSQAIREAIRGFGVERSGKIEILFGEARVPLPFRHHRLEEVKRIGPKVIKTEVVGDRLHEDWERYTDLLFLAAVARSGTDRDLAVGHFEAGLKTWDGIGFRDRVNPRGGLYATYKLALALIAGDRLGRKPVEGAAIRDRLLSMQRLDGGFVTDYDSQGDRLGQANVETTALAILALEVGEKKPSP